MFGVVTRAARRRIGAGWTGGRATASWRGKATVQAKVDGEKATWGTYVAAHGIPLAKSVATIGVSMGAGDAVCQMIEGNGKVGNIERTQMMWFIGTFITGPVSHTWQMVLESRLPGSSWKRIAQKTASNSTFAFFMSLPIMFTAVTLMAVDKEGRRSNTLEDAKEKIKRDLVPTFIAGCFYWPLWNVVIFKFVQVTHRAMAGSLVAVIWNIYLSSVANQKGSPEGDGALAETDPSSCPIPQDNRVKLL